MIPNDFAQGLTALEFMYVGLRQRLNGVGFEDKKRCSSLNKFAPYITNLLFLLLHSYLYNNQITMIPNDFAQGLTALQSLYVGL